MCDEINNAIKNNAPIEENLHMVIVISNACLYIRRYNLAKEFIKRIDNIQNVILYIVELAYDLNGKSAQNFEITDSKNPRHLQLGATDVLWNKENLLNIGVKQLLPDNWKAVALVDCDIDFDNPHFAIDALKVLNGCKDIIQLHSHVIDLGEDNNPINIFSSFGYQVTHGKKYSPLNIGWNFFHCGYNVAMTRKAYEQIGGLYEFSILGAGDFSLFLSLIGRGIESLHDNMTEGYKDTIREYQVQCYNLKLGYISGIIRHYYHGSKKNRRYGDRYKILVKHQYDPHKHLTRNSDNLLIPTSNCPKELLSDIYNYFSERKEDEGINPVIEEMKNEYIKKYGI